MYFFLAGTCVVLLLVALWRRPRHPGLTEAQRQATQPGLGWAESFLGGSQAAEEREIDRMEEQITSVQVNNKNSDGSDSIGRAFHRVRHAAVKNARFTAAADVPAHLQVSFLKPGLQCDVTVRFSNASGQVQPDTARDLRGVVMRVDVPEAGIHDLLMTSAEASHTRDAWQFMQFAIAAAGSKIPFLPRKLNKIIDKLLFLPRLAWRVGIGEALRMLRTVIDQTKRPVESLASEPYFSRSPFSWNGYACKFFLEPVVTGGIDVGKGPRYLRDEITERLKRGPVTFRLRLQMWKDSQSTPIEDGTVLWQPEHVITVGELVIPQQDLTTAEAEQVAAEIDEKVFNPWNSPKTVRPLSSLNRARKRVYTVSSNNRRQGKSLGDQFRPNSRRVGIGALKYVYWNAFYWVMETLNRGLSRDPNRKVSWDKWPVWAGLLYLLAKIRFNRSNALTDPYDYKTNDTKPFGPEPEKVKHAITTDGTYVSDNDNPQMGAAMTRFGSNIPPKKVRPDVEEMTPSARETAKLRWRRLDPETGKEIVVPALILNDLAGWWIQFQFHGFGGNTKRDPVSQCPHMLKRRPDENWPGNVAIVDRTSKDHTRVTDNGRPTVINERVQAWVQGQVYGTNETELNRLRSFQGGKFLLDKNGNLPEDPAKPGVDLTGFSNNFGPGLSFLHWLFVMEHNAIAQHLAGFHPDWDDQTLFDCARKTNVAQIARIHTVEWTEDLLQHPALQSAMHKDWYGFVGPKFKMFLMRMCARYPWLDRLLKPVRDIDFIWGMPGSKWEHHDGPFQVPKHFRVVYRLHEMVLGEHEIIEPGTDRTLDRIGLIDFVHSNTRPIVEKYGYDALCWSFVKKSAGALTLHNFPLALTQFNNQQDGTLTDLAERDIFRERTDGTGSYNEFRMSVGEPPVESFLELTGGDAELAREIELKYEGDINRVDVGIGILAEPKPAGFALGFCQFYQFVLNAPRRVKSNRYLTEGFTYAEYKEGMDWIEHGGGILGAIGRHLPKVAPLTEGVERGFAPWPEVETFPLRMLNRAHTATAGVFKSDLRTWGLGAVAAAIAVCTGTVSLWFALALLGMITVIPAVLTVRRMLAMRYLQLCWKKCYTDKRVFMFGTLERAENSINSAAKHGRLHALAVMFGAAGLAWSFASASPLLAAALALVALSSISTRRWSRTFAEDAHLVKISLRNRMREGQPKAVASAQPGETALEKRYWFLAGKNEKPVATFGSMYQALKDNGLPWWKAAGTAFLSLLSFGNKSKQRLTAAERAALPSWSIWIPGLIDAQGMSNTRIYAGRDNQKGLIPGQVDMEEFELMFRRFAPGRDYMTAYDFARMREANCLRDADEGKGNWLTRLAGMMAAKRRHDQLMMVYADRVVNEDKKLVPAVSKDLMLRFYQGAAQADLLWEHTEGDQFHGVA